MADVPQDSTGPVHKRPALRPFSGHSRDAGQGPLRPFATGRPFVAPFVVRPGHGDSPTPDLTAMAVMTVVAPLAPTIDEPVSERDYPGDQPAVSAALVVGLSGVIVRPEAAVDSARPRELRDGRAYGVAPLRESEIEAQDATSANRAEIRAAAVSTATKAEIEASLSSEIEMEGASMVPSATERSVPTELGSLTTDETKMSPLETQHPNEAVARSTTDDVTEDSSALDLIDDIESSQQPSLDAVVFVSALHTSAPDSSTPDTSVLDTSALDTSSLDTAALDTAALLATDDDATVIDIDSIMYGSAAVHEDRDAIPSAVHEDRDAIPSAVHEDRDAAHSAEADVVCSGAPEREAGYLEFVPDDAAFAFSDEAARGASDDTVHPASYDTLCAASEPAAHAAFDDAVVMSVDPTEGGRALAPPTVPQQQDLLDDALADFQLQASERAELPRPIPGPDLTLRDEAGEQESRTTTVRPAADASALSTEESAIDFRISELMPIVAVNTVESAGAVEVTLAPTVFGGSAESDTSSVHTEMLAADEELLAFVSRARAQAHVVQMLEVVARRVQAGEIVVVADATASPEAVLARVLASLLSP